MYESESLNFVKLTASWPNESSRARIDLPAHAALKLLQSAVGAEKKEVLAISLLSDWTLLREKGRLLEGVSSNLTLKKRPARPAMNGASTNAKLEGSSKCDAATNYQVGSL